MNSRLGDLALEAGLYISLDSGPYPKAMSAEECTAAYQKFAESIVRECGIVADYWVDNEDNGKNLVSLKLKQHFGVE